MFAEAGASARLPWRRGCVATQTRATCPWTWVCALRSVQTTLPRARDTPGTRGHVGRVPPPPSSPCASTGREGQRPRARGRAAPSASPPRPVSQEAAQRGAGKTPRGGRGAGLRVTRSRERAPNSHAFHWLGNILHATQTCYFTEKTNKKTLSVGFLWGRSQSRTGRTQGS